MHINYFSRRGVADRVPNDVLDGAAEELFVAADCDLVANIQRETAGMPRGFDCAILNDVANELVEANIFRSREAGSPSARVISRRALTRVVKRPTSLPMRSLPFSRLGSVLSNAVAKLTRERRAKFVRDILQQASLGSQKSCNPVRHAVEGPRQITDFNSGGAIAGGWRNTPWPKRSKVGEQRSGE